MQRLSSPVRSSPVQVQSSPVQSSPVQSSPVCPAQSSPVKPSQAQSKCPLPRPNPFFCGRIRSGARQRRRRQALIANDKAVTPSLTPLSCYFSQCLSSHSLVLSLSLTRSLSHTPTRSLSLLLSLSLTVSRSYIYVSLVVSLMRCPSHSFSRHSDFGTHSTWSLHHSFSHSLTLSSPPHAEWLSFTRPPSSHQSSSSLSQSLSVLVSLSLVLLLSLVVYPSRSCLSHSFSLHLSLTRFVALSRSCLTLSLPHSFFPSHSKLSLSPP